MPARALLVLLVMLNLGVALWWLLRPPQPSPPAPAQPAGVPRLQLLAERAPAPAPSAPAPAADGAGGIPDDAADGVPAENAAADAPR